MKQTGEVVKKEKPKCGNCVHGEAKLIGKPPVDSGFVICAHRNSRATWFPQRLPCQFTPSKHERRADLF